MSLVDKHRRTIERTDQWHAEKIERHRIADGAVAAYESLKVEIAQTVSWIEDVVNEGKFIIGQITTTPDTAKK